LKTTPLVEDPDDDGYWNRIVLTGGRVPRSTDNSSFGDCAPNDANFSITRNTYTDVDDDNWYGSYNSNSCTSKEIYVNASCLTLGTSNDNWVRMKTSSGWQCVKLSVTGGQDCNDSDPQIYRIVNNVYQDNDKDRYKFGGIQNNVCVGGEQTSGTALWYIGGSGKWFLASGGELGDDCDDNNSTLGPTRTLYIDNDGDGYHGQAILNACSSIATYGDRNCNYATTSGSFAKDYNGFCRSLTTGGLDCNDNNLCVRATTTYLALDRDQDGFVETGPGDRCVGDGTSISGRTYFRGEDCSFSWLLYTGKLGDGDCDPNNSTLGPTRTLYIDNDGDGYHGQAFLNACSSIATYGDRNCSTSGSNFAKDYNGFVEV
jgi:hypothetical protein